jgi:hypothetical protein
LPILTDASRSQPSLSDIEYVYKDSESPVNHHYHHQLHFSHYILNSHHQDISVSKTSFNMQFSKIIAIVSLSATAYSAAVPTTATGEPTSYAACNASGTTSVTCCPSGLIGLLCQVNVLGSQCSNNGNAYCCKNSANVRSSMAPYMQ